MERFRTDGDGPEGLLRPYGPAVAIRAVVIVGEIVPREVDLSPSTLSSRLAARSICALSISYTEYRFYPRDERSVALVRLLIPIRQVLTDSFL